MEDLHLVLVILYVGVVLRHGLCHPVCAHAFELRRAMEQGRLRELVYAKTVDGLTCFDVAQKWGFKNIALVLQVSHQMHIM